MTATEQYQMISKRKSIRKFLMEPLGEAQISALTEQLNHLQPLRSDISTEIRLLPQDTVGGLLSIKAPHYLLLFSEKKEGHLENAGFIMQQIDLYLSANGIGACWLGAAKPKSEFTGNSTLPYIISMAIGMPAEPLHRAGLEQFKRKKMSEICSTAHHLERVEAARLAPSATNSQPWRFITTHTAIHAYRIKLGALKSMIYERMNQIDMGIALCHLWIAAEAHGYRARLTTKEEASVMTPAGTTYIMTMEMEEAHKFKHSKKALLDDEWRRKHLPAKDTLTALKLEPDGNAADVGCGIGYFTLPIAEMIGSEYTVYGLDTSEQMLEEVILKVKKKQLSNVRTIQTDEYDFKLEDAAVTYVLMANVLHEVSDRIKFLQETSRILTPKGRLALLDYEKNESIPGPPIHHRISRDEAKKMLAQAGFEVLLETEFADQFYGIVAVKTVNDE
jgi:ubiquinone/menaquinone biosynthesis C-methylase UbiE